MEGRVLVGFRLLKMAALYMVIALAGGIFMGMSEDHTLATVHSHVALLGWTTMALTGLVYIALPPLSRSALSKGHFWLHSLGLPLMMVSLGCYAYGYTAAEPIIGLGSIITFLALLLFAVNVFRNAKG
jgi:cbb3-type cytochrome oxidase subunit 1